jgi:hypothetical protein
VFLDVFRLLTVMMDSPIHPETSIPSSLQNDVEKTGDYAHLTNTAIRSYAWEGVTVTVKDRETKQPKAILSNINGIVKGGKCHHCSLKKMNCH